MFVIEVISGMATLSTRMAHPGRRKIPIFEDKVHVLSLASLRIRTDPTLFARMKTLVC